MVHWVSMLDDYLYNYQEIGGKVDFSDMELSLFTEDKIVEEIYGSILREIRDEVNIPLDNLSQPLLLGIAANKCGYGRPSSEFIVRSVPVYHQSVTVIHISLYIQF